MTLVRSLFDRPCLGGLCADRGRFAAGANPSAEEAEESAEDGATTVNNVIHSFRLQPTSFDKKSYLAYLKVSNNNFRQSGGMTISYRAT